MKRIGVKEKEYNSLETMHLHFGLLFHDSWGKKTHNQTLFSFCSM